MQTCARRRAHGALRAIVLLTPMLVALGGHGTGEHAGPPAQDRTAPFPRAGTYAGEAVCKECHEEQHAAIHAGVHAPVVQARHLHACETCHGPGDAHARDEDNDYRLITHPPDLGRGVVAVCGRCHAEAVRAHGGDLEGFLAAGKTCTSCHRVHVEKPEAPPHDGLAFHTRRALAAHGGAQPTGAPKCLECHPLRDQLLARSVHAHLAAARDAAGCETCHGPGSLHAETGGIARLITRPDRAGDGVSTCRSCHEEVDPIEFHWRDRRKPLLSAGLTCTTCHTIHAPAPGRPARTGALDGAPIDAVLASRDGATNATCARCHEPALKGRHGTVHRTLMAADVPLSAGCAACHEGAEAHAAAGGRRDALVPVRGGAAHEHRLCARCHEQEPALAAWHAGSHARHDVGCTSCHSLVSERGHTRRDAEGRCASCHQAVAAEFRLPNRHPVPEHAVDCSDCHDPHGARDKVRDLELRQERCVRCHTQYRGPFVFPHQASRSDGCTVCHLPHGSTNKRLLRQHNSQQNCLQCHGDFPSFHDQTQGAVFTNCLACHTEVHGSNHSRFLFR
ncbi:MAG TPA: cytochrome c3 family protein [Planctomycetota bacterium]|nr:cytochrome c3 family protein [Planctomycetota bacterium]